MLAAAVTRGFQEFMLTAEAAGAPPWQLDQLRALEWPEDREPTAETFRGLLWVLNTATAAEADRRAG